MNVRSKAAVMLVQPELALDAYLQALLAAVADDDAQPETTTSAVAVDSPQADIGPAVAVAAPEPGALPVAPSPAVEGEFYALFFRVGEITLATPVLDLRRIVDFDAGITVTALPKQPSWLLGLVDNQGERIGIMHTAELLLGKEKIACRDFGARPYRKIIVSRHGRYGFACDEVLEMVKLGPGDVRWRESPRRRRPWLIGTVSERLSVLVDLAELTPVRR